MENTSLSFLQIWQTLTYIFVIPVWDWFYKPIIHRYAQSWLWKKHFKQGLVTETSRPRLGWLRQGKHWSNSEFQPVAQLKKRERERDLKYNINSWNVKRELCWEPNKELAQNPKWYIDFLRSQRDSDSWAMRPTGIWLRLPSMSDREKRKQGKTGLLSYQSGQWLLTSPVRLLLLFPSRGTTQEAVESQKRVPYNLHSSFPVERKFLPNIDRKLFPGSASMQINTIPVWINYLVTIAALPNTC